MNDLFLLLSASIVGLIIGLLTGIFGVGGGFLLTPALMILLQVPGPVAVGTGLAFILPNSILCMIKRTGSATVDLKLATFISVGSVIGVLIGSFLMDILKSISSLSIFGQQQNPVQYILLALFCVILSAIALYLFYDYQANGGKAPSKRVGLLTRIRIPPYAVFPSLEEPKLSIVAVVGMGVIIGILTGLLGIGGGVVLLPGLIYLIGQRTIKAAGTSLMIVFVSSLIAVVRKGVDGDIDLKLLTMLFLGGVPGTFAGTRIGLQLSGPRVRLYLVYVVIAAVVIVGTKLYCLTF